MSNKNSIAVKIPKEVYEDIDKALKIRLDKGLISKNQFRMTEGFRILRKTAGYHQSIQEMTKEKVILNKRK